MSEHPFPPDRVLRLLRVRKRDLLAEEAVRGRAPPTPRPSPHTLAMLARMGVPECATLKSERRTCGAKTRAGTPCRCLALPGKFRCKLHGGLSTGPKTAEGWARTRAGRDAYWARRRAQVGSAKPEARFSRSTP